MDSRVYRVKGTCNTGWFHYDHVVTTSKDRATELSIDRYSQHNKKIEGLEVKATCLGVVDILDPDLIEEGAL